MLAEPNSILVIEDHLPIRRFLKTALISQGYHFYEASTGQEGLKITIDVKPKLILLDLGLPDMDGLALLKQLRTWTALPIIILSARDQEFDKIKALDLGADDYLTKPFSIGELNARLRVALRHGQWVNESETPLIQFADIKIDLVNREVWVKEKRILLSPIQFAILATLARRANKIVTHAHMLETVWNKNHIEDIDYLRIYIHQLRQKIEVNPAYPKYLKTEPGIGYRLATGE